MNPSFYFTFPDHEKELLAELGPKAQKKSDNIFLAPENPTVAFAQDIWHNPQTISFQSIGEAAQHLKQAGKYWVYVPQACVRRGRLIEEKLFKPLPTKLDFPVPEKTQNAFLEAGAYTLLDDNTLVLAKQRQRAIPFGLCEFKEDKENPPNRAYLKLWEALTILNARPKAGDFALDLGASPGGWTWVLQQCGATVCAIDKAPLDPRIAALPNVTAKNESAFALSPKEFDRVDWLCSDMACYPERLYGFVQPWIESGKVEHMVCTLKLQGKTDFEMIKKFQALPNSRVFHLFYNKHEATFLYKKA